MVAGATGIDLFLMVVAADDGVMPQTREHAAVLRGARRADRASSRSPRPTSPTPSAALLEAAELLPERGGGRRLRRHAAPGSTSCGPRWTARRPRLGRARRRRRRAPAARRPRVHDPGRGDGGHRDAVVRARRRAATSSSLLPAGPARARARRAGARRAGRARATAGQRVALNLAGRGGARGRPRRRGRRPPAAASRPTYRVDAALVTATARSTGRGCRSTTARARHRAAGAGSGGRFYQLRLEQPLVPAAGDRLVIRQIAPPDTLGGGVVLDPHPRRHGPVARPARAAGAAGARRAGAAAAPSRRPAPTRSRAAPAHAPPPWSSRSACRRRARHEPPLEAELGAAAAELGRRCARAGRAVRVGRNLHFHPEALADVRERVVAAHRARRLDHARRAARRAGHLAQVRAGAARALRRRAVTRRLPDDGRCCAGASARLERAARRRWARSGRGLGLARARAPGSPRPDRAIPRRAPPRPAATTSSRPPRPAP